jgi:hypothetical protein
MLKFHGMPFYYLWPTLLRVVARLQLTLSADHIDMVIQAFDGLTRSSSR